MNEAKEFSVTESRKEKFRKISELVLLINQAGKEIGIPVKVTTSYLTPPNRELGSWALRQKNGYTIAAQVHIMEHAISYRCNTAVKIVTYGQKHQKQMESPKISSRQKEEWIQRAKELINN